MRERPRQRPLIEKRSPHNVETPDLIVLSAALMWGNNRLQHPAQEAKAVSEDEIVKGCVLAQSAACILPSKSSCANVQFTSQG
jgi:hypothetical protein